MTMIDFFRHNQLARLILFAFIAFIAMSTAHVISNIRSGAEGDQVWQVHHTQTMLISLSYTDAFNLCLEAIDQIEKSEIRHSRVATGNITADAGVTWKTWGDTINCQVTAVDEQTTEVTFSSKPVVWTTLFDYGKNFSNIKTIEQAFANP